MLINNINNNKNNNNNNNNNDNNNNNNNNNSTSNLVLKHVTTCLKCVAACFKHAVAYLHH